MSHTLENKSSPLLWSYLPTWAPLTGAVLSGKLRRGSVEDEQGAARVRELRDGCNAHPITPVQFDAAEDVWTSWPARMQGERLCSCGLTIYRYLSRCKLPPLKYIVGVATFSTSFLAMLGPQTLRSGTGLWPFLRRPHLVS